MLVYGKAKELTLIMDEQSHELQQDTYQTFPFAHSQILTSASTATTACIQLFISPIDAWVTIPICLPKCPQQH